MGFTFCPDPEILRRQPQRQLDTKRVLSGGGWTPAVELVHGSYFSFILYYASTGPNFYIVPFLALFVTGYFYLGGMSLLQKPCAAGWPRG